MPAKKKARKKVRCAGKTAGVYKVQTQDTTACEILLSSQEKKMTNQFMRMR